ncbi:MULTISPECIES: DUF308 domain-containing protein [Halorussus]|uniref:DUF308 domain-containing protein n=1 Tax=Halorussus TaxID=1070314 RepID=UPI00209EC419|nr:DUF308 domain-containing protein [Halorussus vallis]USZ74928.1 DUF308 domain-containing protein [Halorussus vallis]
MSLDDDHPILSTVGVAAVALGVLMVLNPGLAGLIGTGYVAVTLVGLLALVQAARVAGGRKASDVAGADTPDVETVPTMPTPGREFDDRLADLRSGLRRETVRRRAEIEEMLRETALDAVAADQNCSREAAAERLEAGTWTDDPHAAAFLGESEVPPPPLLDRLRVAASTESKFQLRARRTADAVARLSDADPGPDATATDTPDAERRAPSGGRPANAEVER